MSEQGTPHPAIRATAYACEALGCAWNLGIGLCAIFFDFSPNLPMSHWLPSTSVRLLLTGLIYSGSGSLFALSPPGKLSGAHINPAVSLAFWADRKMHTLDLIGYVLAQFLGSLFAAFLMIKLWGHYAGDVNSGVTAPGVGWSVPAAFFAEVLMTALLTLTIFLFVSSHRLMHWTAMAVWILVAVEVWLGAPISGTSLNTARSFGPALVADFWQHQWIYFIAPPLGGLLGVLLFRLTAWERKVLTAKLFHHPRYPTIFKNVHVPSKPVKSRAFG